jgi:threonylcarbamoyladenosine tRNA methylthiotransferase MtaB
MSADLVIVNSCTVTANSDRKTRQYLRQVRRGNPRAVVVLAGCMPQAYPVRAAAIEEADIVTGTGDRLGIPGLVDRFLARGERIVSIGDSAGRGFERLAPGAMEGHTRAFLKIADGCPRRCAYCIVPQARGQLRSMPLDDIERQAGAFAEKGYRELVLSGVNLSLYGLDTGHTLADAVERAAAAGRPARLRLSSLEPDLLSEKTLERLAALDNLCPHFHLSLQSGCDATLSRMGRGYKTAGYAALTGRIRELFDRPSFTTDVIVGFPGETDENFFESLDFVSGFGFLKVHVFPYSRRPGTPAAELPGQLDRRTKARRAALMSQKAEAARLRVMESSVGQTVRVVAEQPLADGFAGYTDRYLPAIVSGADIAGGDVVMGRVSGIKEGRCLVAAL